MVPGMADEQIEPGEVTSRFQAFAEGSDPAPSKALPLALLAVIAAVFVVAVVVVVVLLNG
jgi:hypothetical protein